MDKEKLESDKSYYTSLDIEKTEVPTNLDPVAEQPFTIAGFQFEIIFIPCLLIALPLIFLIPRLSKWFFLYALVIAGLIAIWRNHHRKN